MTRRIPLGIALIGAGLFLALRPFTALAVLCALTALAFIFAGFPLVAAGISSRRHPRHHRRAGPALIERLRRLEPEWLRRVPAAQVGAGVLLVALGVAAAVWPHVTYIVFTYGPLLGLLGFGLFTLGHFALTLRTARGRLGTLTARPLVFGPAAILLAFAGWPFPDVVLMLVAFATGAGILAAGILCLHPRRRPVRPGWRRVGTVAAVPVALAALVASSYLAAHPAPDEFYTPPPGADTQAAPGTLLRSEPHPAPPGAQGLRILYTTTRDAGARPALASAVIYTPEQATAAPILAWAHGTTGQTTGCAPSLTGVESGAMYVLDDVLAAGWAVVATDYTGLGTSGAHPYLIGEGEGRSVIDAVRAATQTQAPLGEQTVLWGHSQGGHAALWAGGLWEDYAPELPLLGVAAFAPATDLPAIFDAWGRSKLANIFASYMLSGYGEHYEDVDARDYVRPGARATAASYANRCLADRGTALTLVSSLLQEGPIWSDPAIDGPLRARAEENVPTRPIGAPVLILQGGADGAIPPAVQDDYAAARCGQGWRLDYRTYDGLDHLPLVEADSGAMDDAFLWTATLFAGEDVPEGACG